MSRTASQERAGLSGTASDDVRYQSFKEFNAGPPPGPTTSDVMRHAHLVLVSTTQTKLVGSLLLGFSLIALLQRPPDESSRGEPIAKLCLGIAVATTFAATTFAMLEFHYLHTLALASELYLGRDKDYDLESLGGDSGAFADADGIHPPSGLGSGGLGGGLGTSLGVALGVQLGSSPGGSGSGPKVESGYGAEDADDAKLAAKFKALLVDLEHLRASSRLGLWAAMMLLVVATLLRLGSGDLGFVVVGALVVCGLGAAAAAPVLRRLRASYAPLIKEFRGVAASESINTAAL